MMQFRMEVRGLERILKKLSPSLLDRPLRNFLTAASIVVQSKTRDRAPVDTGRLVNSLAAQVDSAQPPRWAKVGTNVRSNRGFPYPVALDQSDRYHYRGGKAKGQVSNLAVRLGKKRGGVGIEARMGRKTKGWFSDVPGLVRSTLNNLLRNMGTEIRQYFDR